MSAIIECAFVNSVVTREYCDCERTKDLEIGNSKVGDSRAAQVNTFVEGRKCVPYGIMERKISELRMWMCRSVGWDRSGYVFHVYFLLVSTSTTQA
jgi:hypothetical protein